MSAQLPLFDEPLVAYGRLPKIIQTAITRAFGLPHFSCLTKRERLAFSDLVSRTQAKNGCAPFWFSMEKVAEAVNVSTKTVQRMLKQALKMGWLTLVGDRRDDSGKKTYYTMAFVPEVACMLGLPAVSEDGHRTKLSVCLIEELSFKKDKPGAPEASLQEEQQNPTPAIQLPPELAVLPDELGIKDTGIAKLRGEAYQAGYSLADIVACARGRLQELGARGGRAFRYLQTMIARPKADYAGRAAQAARIAADEAEAARDTETAEKLAGRRFRASNGTVFRFLPGGNAEIIGAGGNFGGIAAGREHLRQLHADIAAGILLEVQAAQVATPPPAAPPTSSGPKVVSSAALSGIAAARAALAGIKAKHAPPSGDDSATTAPVG